MARHVAVVGAGLGGRLVGSVTVNLPPGRHRELRAALLTPAA